MFRNVIQNDYSTEYTCDQCCLQNRKHLFVLFVSVFCFLESYAGFFVWFLLYTFFWLVKATINAQEQVNVFLLYKIET